MFHARVVNHFLFCMGEREFMMYNKRSYNGKASAVSRSKRKLNDHAQLLRLQRAVAVLKPEIKHWQVASTVINIGAAGTGAAFTGIAQGTTDLTRIGDSVRGKQLRVRVSVTELNAALSNQLRVFIFRDTQCAGAVPAVNGTSSALLSSASVVTAMLNRNTSRYKIIDELTFGPQANGVGGNNNGLFIDRTYNLRDMTIKYLGATAAATDLGANSLFWIAISSDTFADFVVSSEFAYTDI